MTRALAPLPLAIGATIALVALGLAACDREVRITKKDQPANGSVLKTVTRLDCPETQGDLKRMSLAADGLTCAYAAKDQGEVTLRLVATNGDEDAALAAVEADLRDVVPPPAASPTPPADLHADSGDEDAHIRLPGLSIDAEGDRAQIRIGGLRIDGDGDRANISVAQGKGGTVNIAADDGNATIRQTRSNARGVRRSVIFATDTPGPAGYRVAGYEARGPKAGPLVIAIVRAKGQGDTDDMFKDMKALVARNVGR